MKPQECESVNERIPITSDSTNRSVTVRITIVRDDAAAAHAQPTLRSTQEDPIPHA